MHTRISILTRVVYTPFHEGNDNIITKIMILNINSEYEQCSSVVLLTNINLTQ